MALLDAWHDVATLVTFRTLPCAGYSLVTPSLGAWPKAAIALATAGLFFIPGVWPNLGLDIVAVSYAYFAAMGCVVPALGRWFRARRVTAGGLFACCASAFFVIPALVASSQTKAAVVTVIAWDLMLSSYSYCVDTSKAGVEPALGECLFFLLVNPALVYAQRGHRFGPPRIDVRGLGRVALAVGTFFFVLAALSPIYDSVRSRALRAAAIRDVPWILAVVGSALVRFFILYGRQSALASLQIGLLRQLGFAIPERYRWPIVATGPADFFRRWNTYIGQWLLRYLFWPASFRFGRGRSRTARALTTGLAVMATFAACGVLHDAVIYVSGFTAGTKMLAIFLAAGALVVASAGLAMMNVSASDRFGASGRWLSRGGLWIAIVAICFKWLP